MNGFVARQTPYLSQHMYDGELYTLTTLVTIAAGASLNLQNKVGNRIFHTIAREHSFEGGGPITVTVTEAPTVTDGTIAITAVNMNRLSTKMHTAQFFVDPTAISGGILLDTLYLPATGPNSTGFAGEGAERNLKPNTDYMLTATNSGSQDSTFWTRVIFFESGN